MVCIFWLLKKLKPFKLFTYSIGRGTRARWACPRVRWRWPPGWTSWEAGRSGGGRPSSRWPGNRRSRPPGGPGSRVDTQVSFVQNSPVSYFTKNTHYFVKFVLLAKLAFSGGKKTRKRNKTKNGTKLEKGTKFEKVQNFEKKLKKWLRIRYKIWIGTKLELKVLNLKEIKQNYKTKPFETFFRIFIFFSVSRNDRYAAKQAPVSYSFVFRNF